MALTASLRCYPLLGSAAASSVSLPASTRAPVLHRTTGGPRRRLQRCLCSQQYAEKQSSGSQQQQLERLFSNLNQATMKHEPGSVTSSIFLVAGTTIVTDWVDYQNRLVRGDMHSEKPLKGCNRVVSC
uniref:Uncharacterized protein n=1 Tax=Oryza rufipogon TaxID=4529 RepID=A0A0E0NTL6_ORYRU